ncbi:unnamed protein product, partial [Amoebophrya sp. A25]|eukprot:GSA25T00005911001.1
MANAARGSLQPQDNPLFTTKFWAGDHAVQGRSSTASDASFRASHIVTLDFAPAAHKADEIGGDIAIATLPGRIHNPGVVPGGIKRLNSGARVVGTSKKGGILQG